MEWKGGEGREGEQRDDRVAEARGGDVIRLMGAGIRAMWYLISHKAAPNVRVVCIRSTNASSPLGRPTLLWVLRTTSLLKSSNKRGTMPSVTTGPSESSCTRC